MLPGYKTYVIAACMLVYQAIGWYLYGTPPDVMRILEAAGLAALRAGVSKSGPRSPEAP